MSMQRGLLSSLVLETPYFLVLTGLLILKVFEGPTSQP